MATSSLYDLQSISKSLSPLNFTATSAASSTAATTSAAALPAASSTSTTAATTDHVSLSEEAKQLYQQGQSTSSIASNLSTDNKTVASYLSISANSTLQKNLLETLTAALK